MIGDKCAQRKVFMIEGLILNPRLLCSERYGVREDVDAGSGAKDDTEFDIDIEANDKDDMNGNDSNNCIDNNKD